MDIQEEIASHEEKFKEIFTKNSKPEVNEIQNLLNAGEINKAGVKMNKFNHDVFKYQKIQKEKNLLSDKKRKLPTKFGRGEIDESFFRNEKGRIDGIIDDLDKNLKKLEKKITN